MKIAEEIEGHLQALPVIGGTLRVVFFHPNPSISLIYKSGMYLAICLT